MKQLITLTLFILSIACFGQAEAKAKGLSPNIGGNKGVFAPGSVIGDTGSGSTPKWESPNMPIELPKDVQKKLMSLDSVIQAVNKQYREIVEPLQKQQQLIFEMAFSFKGVEISKVDSIQYDKGIITYKVKPK